MGEVICKEDRMTQHEFVVDYMRKNGTVTQHEMFPFYIERLSAVIHTLRHREGFTIWEFVVPNKRRSGSHAAYYLVGDDYVTPSGKARVKEYEKLYKVKEYGG